MVAKRRLRGAEHAVIPDRIEAGTFAVAGAVTGGQVTLTGAPCDHMTAFLDVLERAGVSLRCDADRIEIDGRGVNGKFWFFYGALSDVQYQIQVKDRVTGNTKTYTNPQGQLSSVADTNALPGN